MNTILFNHLKQSLEKKLNGKKWIPEKWNPYQVAMNSAQDNTTFQMFWVPFDCSVFLKTVLDNCFLF